MSEPASDGAPGSVECIVPILNVANLQASIEYYVAKLGFKLDWAYEEQMASVSRGSAAVMLCQKGQGHPGTWVWIGVNDCVVFFDEFTKKGARIPLPPTNYPWAQEIHVQDPDGHVLRFGSDSLRDKPVSQWVAWYENSEQV